MNTRQAPTDNQLVRASTICPLCQGEKAVGLVACWPCFRAWDMRNGTGGAEAVIATTEALLAAMEARSVMADGGQENGGVVPDHGNAAIPHPNTDECTAACNNAVPEDNILDYLKMPLQWRTVDGVDVQYHPSQPIDYLLEESAKEIERLKGLLKMHGAEIERLTAALLCPICHQQKGQCHPACSYSGEVVS